MALNGAYVDVDFIIDKLEQDFGFDDIQYNDVVEDIWDIIGYVSDPSTFERKFAEVVIADYRGQIPSDFYSIVDGAIMEIYTKTPLVESTDLMDRFSSDTTILADTDALNYSYKIIQGYLYTGLEDANLIMSYKAFPTNNSLPLVPDNAKAIRGVVNYIGERIAFRLMLKDKLSERKYEIIRQESLFSTASYKTSSKIPSIDTMERLKNIHLNILRNPNMHDNNFKHLGTRARVFTSTINNTGLSNTIYFEVTATANGQTIFSRPSDISAANLETIKALGTWVVTISGTDYALTYGNNVTYTFATDSIVYVGIVLGALTIGDVIFFTYNIQ